MTTITIDLGDENLATLLHARAVDHRRSLEDEALDLLCHALRHPPLPDKGLHTYFHLVCGPLGDEGIETPARTPYQPPDLA